MQQSRKTGIFAAVVLAVVFTVLIASASGQAVTYRELWGFGSAGDGAAPSASVIFDASGNLYGTTSIGGTHSECGMVFELSPTSSGLWNEKTLIDFNCSNGRVPLGGLVMDAAGNLYGTTSEGGTSDAGVVFELSPNSDGTWTETVIHSFNPTNRDGGTPMSSLIFDAAGNLYGTTWSGGMHGFGTVFELTPSSGGEWTETILWSFNRSGNQAYNPNAGVIFDAAGNLYGTTVNGGGIGCTAFNGCGTVFELSPSAGGWTEKALHSFAGGTTDGANPYGGVILDSSGNLYGTTKYNGKNGSSMYSGTVFELSPQANGTWKEKLLHNFGTSTDGSEPLASLTLENSDLYGTTEYGGAYGGGTVFELIPGSNGNWTEHIVYNFNHKNNDCTNGCAPQDAVIFDGAGNIYGTTQQGGTNGGHGTVFEITP